MKFEVYEDCACCAGNGCPACAGNGLVLVGYQDVVIEDVLMADESADESADECHRRRVTSPHV
jgi:hypothetical protein